MCPGPKLAVYRDEVIHMRAATRTTITAAVGCVLMFYASAGWAQPGGVAPPATGDGKKAGELPAQKEFSGCKKIPPGRRVLKMTFKPDSEIADLVSWISTVSCTQFVTAGHLLKGRKFTLMAPQLVSAQEAYELFIGALTSVGLTARPEGKFVRIIETPPPPAKP